MTNSFCVRCKTQTGTSGAKLVTSVNGRRMIKGICTVCGTNKSQFVSSSASSSSATTAARAARVKKGKKAGAGVWDVFKMIF